jgi:nuclear cap-binding protein subunit 1
MPYVLASSASGFEQHALALLEKTDIIASTPHSLEALVDPYPSNEEEQEADSISVIGLLQKQLQAESSQGWELSCIPRPWKVSLGDEQIDPLMNAPKHAFPAIAVPPTLNQGSQLMFPELYISVYVDQQVEVSIPIALHCWVMLTTEDCPSQDRHCILNTTRFVDRYHKCP